MYRVLLERLRQGHRTGPFPDAPAQFPARFRGRPEVDPSKCPPGCGECAGVCPSRAIETGPGRLRLDLGKCVLCPLCTEACPAGAITTTREPAMAVRRREDLVLRGASELPLAAALDRSMRSLFGRSLKLRQVSAGGCNGCEAELIVSGTVVFDIGRFGIQFVASPRHADGIVVTGPVTANMRHALLETYAAVPPPRLVIAVGACAISGGVFAGGPETNGGLGDLLPVDLYVPGCPPHPVTFVDGMLRLLGRLGSPAGAERMRESAAPAADGASA